MKKAPFPAGGGAPFRWTYRTEYAGSSLPQQVPEHSADCGYQQDQLSQPDQPQA